MTCSHLEVWRQKYKKKRDLNPEEVLDLLDLNACDAGFTLKAEEGVFLCTHAVGEEDRGSI